MKSSMTNARRDLMHLVMGGQTEISVILYHFDRYRRCDDMLKWLIANHLTGREFVAWMDFHFGRSILRAAGHILMRIGKESQPQAVKVGRDYLVAGRT